MDYKTMTLLDVKNFVLYGEKTKYEYDSIDCWKNIEAITNNLQTTISNQSDKLHRRNMQIAELKPFKQLVEIILQMTNIHGLYENEKHCVDSIRSKCAELLNVKS